MTQKEIARKLIKRALDTPATESTYQPKNFQVNIRLCDRDVFETLGQGNAARGVELAARIVREVWLGD